MIYLIPIFTLLNVILAFIDSRIIVTKHKVLHGLNGAVYLIAVGFAVWWFNNYWLIPSLLLDRLLFFNIPLSLFRGKKWNYISPAPKAITDKIAKAIFGDNALVMYVIYAILFIATLFIIFI